MGNSRVEEAYSWQGIKFDNDGNVNDSYPGHDSYQNGVIPNGSDLTIYCTKWEDGQLASGYFTDKGTVDSCTHNGVLNANELGEALQTASSNYGTNGGDYQHKPYCTAYDVDWDRLNELKSENPELYGRLTNPDGMSPGNDGLKCAYGRAEANPQYGNGGGNQYYIDKDAFNDAVKEGVFKENPDKSFSEEKGNLSRKDIPNDATYENNMTSLKDCVEEAEEDKKQPTPEQLNNFEVKENPANPYIARPDTAYGYSRNNSNQNSESNTNNDNQSAQYSQSRPNAPPGHSNVNNMSQSQNVQNQNQTSGQSRSDQNQNQTVGQSQSGLSQNQTRGQSQGGQSQKQTNGQSQSDQSQNQTDGQNQSGQSQNQTGTQTQSGQSNSESKNHNQPQAKSSEGHVSSQKQQSIQGGQEQSGGQNTNSSSSGMSTKAANSDQTSSGSGKQNSSDGMSTTAAGSNQSNSKGASGGMSTTAAGGGGKTSSSSSGGQSQEPGRGM